MLALETFCPERWLRFCPGCFGVFVQLLQRCLQNNGASLHGKVRLGAGQLFRASSFFYLNILCAIEAVAALGADEVISIYANVLPCSSHLPPSVAHCHRDCARFLARLDECRKFYLSSFSLEPHNVAIF